MTRQCELTGKSVMTGNNVSHAKNRTRRRFLPNLNNVSLMSETLGKSFKFKICAAALRSVVLLCLLAVVWGFKVAKAWYPLG